MSKQLVVPEQLSLADLAVRPRAKFIRAASVFKDASE